jgi:triacylglycerol lipase
VRGAQLAKAVEEILAKTGREKVNLIGHSQGGLDARVVAHDHPAWVASVLTVATPHRGSEVADVVLKLTSNDRLGDLLDDLVQVVGGPIYGDVADGTSLSSSMQQLATASSATFNAKYPDAPGVTYLSMTGRSSSRLAEIQCQTAQPPPYFIKKYALVRDPIEPLLAVSALIIEHGGDAPSDGLVTVESSKWGEFLGCVPADHFDEIGHLFDDSPGFGNSFDHLELYVGLVDLLRQRGF